MLSRRSFISGMGAASAVAISTGHADTLRLVQEGDSLAARGGQTPARLCYNENPHGFPEAARMAVMGAFGEGHQYPIERRGDLMGKIAGRFGLAGNHILLGNGSAEILYMTVLAQNAPRLKIFAPAFTFEVVAYHAFVLGIEYEAIPVKDDYTVDIEGLQQAAAAHDGPVLLYLTSPNNPTGELLSSSMVHKWVETAPDNHFFLIDEAYGEFVRDPEWSSAIDLVKRGQQNLIVSKTFSKIFGMAGLRVGYALAHPDVIQRVSRMSATSNLNILGLRAAEAAIDDQGFIEKSLTDNQRGKEILEETLRELDLGWVSSYTNFVFHEIRLDVTEYQNRMREHGVLVGRKMGDATHMNRLSIGTPAEMERFAETLHLFRRNGWV